MSSDTAQPSSNKRAPHDDNNVESETKKYRIDKHTDCDHTGQLDKSLMGFDINSELWHLAVFQSCKQLDEKYRDKKEWDLVYAQNKEEFQQIYQECQAAGNFDAFRDLEILAKVVKKSSSSVDESNQQHEDDPKMKGVAQAWQEEYQGNSHNIFINAIQEMNRRRDAFEAYANCLAVVQSSGTGKSRLVDKAAESIFCIPFNLRENDRGGHVGYPVADAAVRDHLTTPVSVGYPAVLATVVKKTMERNRVFLATTLKAAAEVLSAEGKRRQGGFDSPEALARWWRGYLMELQETKTRRELLYSDIVRQSRRIDDEGGPSGLEEASLELITTIESLVPKGSYKDESNNIRVLVYFDEAHTLSELCMKSGRVDTLVHLLIKTLADIASHAIFSVFLSTSFRFLGYIAPPAKGSHPYNRIIV